MTMTQNRIPYRGSADGCSEGTIEDNLEMAFETTVLGVLVTVKGVTQTESGIVADCVRDDEHQAISVLDLPLPEPAPKGAEWIAAYRHWTR
jgi:hypothetical protein